MRDQHRVSDNKKQPGMSMKMSAKGYEILRHFEGLELEAYKCPAGIPTIGYGSTFYEDGKPVKMGDKITRERAEQLLPNIVRKFEQAVERFLKIPVLQHEFDACVLLAYNIGIGNFEKSTLLRNINQGKPKADVVAQFHVWNKAGGKVLPGLVRRRASEAHLYATGEVKF